MLTKSEITKFDDIINFCSRASREISNEIRSSSSIGYEALFSAKPCEEFLAKVKNNQAIAANAKLFEDTHARLITDKQAAQDQALKVARLKILRHSIELIKEQLQELGSPYNFKKRNEYRPLHFWEKTYAQHATFYTHKQNFQSIQMVNKLYNRDDYGFNETLNFVVKLKEQANLDQIIKPVNNIYYFMFCAFVGLLAPLCTAIALIAIYATPVVSMVLMTVLTLLALTSLSSARAYYDQHTLLSGKYEPLSKTHSFIDVSAAVENDDFNDLVKSNIRQILGQGPEEVHASNRIQVNALAEIGLEQIKNDYLSTLSQA